MNRKGRHPSSPKASPRQAVADPAFLRLHYLVGVASSHEKMAFKILSRLEAAPTLNFLA
jgi:hypothetical protein